MAVRDGAIAAGQGALREVRQTLAWKVLAPEVARFLMSNLEGAEGWAIEASTPGLPMTKFFRTRFPVFPAKSNIPLELPTMMLSSMMLSVAVAPPGVPMPKLLPGVDKPFPLIRFARSRLRLAPPASHIPPQAAVGCEFLIATLFSSTFSDPLFT